MKKDMIIADGIITECSPGTLFKVKLEDTDNVIICHLSGKIRINSIKLVNGDKVSVEISPYDLKKGRICYRYR
jgi:translation initiation factor IF-1